MRGTGNGICWICGGILTLVGSIFTGVGLWLFKNMDYVYSHGTGNAAALPFIFAILGACILVFGVGILAYSAIHARKQRSLLENGQYVIAQITGVVPDFTVQINRFPTYKIECSYFEPSTGATQIFYSRNLTRDPSGFLMSSTVRVYMDRDSRDYKNYYVDIDAVLPDKKWY